MAGIVVNGEPRDLHGVPLHTNALDFLRGCGLTGAKEGCAEGECGACSVMVARPAPDGSDATEWTAINSCLVPAASLDGQEVVTAEGLGSPDDLHPVQHEMAVRGGSQCGYCTPGFVCSMAAEFYRAGRAATNGSGPHDHYHGDNGFDLHAVSGNLCRCTGYRPIQDAAFALAFPASDDELAARRTSPAPAPMATQLHDGEAAYLRPADLAEALRLLHDHDDATVVAGSTDWGVDVNLKGARAGLVVAVDRLAELRGFTITEHRGPDRRRAHADRGRAAPRRPAAAAAGADAAVRLAADPQRRHPRRQPGHRLADRRRPAGAARPRGVRRARLDRWPGVVERTVPLADYFTGYRESVRRPGELITEVVVPLPAAELTAFHKIAKRAFDDISSVAVGFAIDVR